MNISQTVFNYIDKVKKAIKRPIKKAFRIISIWKVLFYLAILGLIIAGIILIWISTFDLPNLNNFNERQVAQSTKIYDKTGEIILFDVHDEIKRTVVPFDEISEYVKQATVAIEDKSFYEHNGIKISSIFRAILINIRSGNLLGGQGGSTITQQVIKNALLTTDKKVSRKIKEWVLAPRLENLLSKEEILSIYLNEVPYGGSVYGVQEASRRFFAKDAKDLTIAESAYLASLPQAPTYFSPYGSHLDKLEIRKDFVLEQMFEVGFITQEQLEEAKNEEVTFERPEEYGIKAPHFVIWIREQLAEEFGEDVVEQGGLKVITTLDWELQKQAEEIVKKHALANKENFDAENAALVAVDPKTGQILTMVGSRDYFDEEIDGNFNIALAARQPGSSFKPFVYAEAFNIGYRPSTILFDVKTEFSATCSNGGNCYSPVNFDNKYRGPMSIRSALGESRNIPAVKTLYLVGIDNAINLAEKMGITTLGSAKQYGLTLVLGGGEVKPIDMATAYATFANQGKHNPYTGILRIEDKDGNLLKEYKKEEERVLPKQTALLITDVLSDDVARTPTFGANSNLYFGNRSVAAKTGTTNDYRDAWVVGFTPDISVAAWAGNNDNRPVKRQSGRPIITPMWREFMDVALKDLEHGSFESPAELPIEDIKPIILGDWESGGARSILHWVQKRNPLGPIPTNPNIDPQYALWEEGVINWARENGVSTNGIDDDEDQELRILNPRNNQVFKKSEKINVSASAKFEVKSGEVFVNNEKVGNIDISNLSFSFDPQSVSNIAPENTLVVKIVEEEGQIHIEAVNFGITE